MEGDIEYRCLKHCLEMIMLMWKKSSLAVEFGLKIMENEAEICNSH